MARARMALPRLLLAAAALLGLAAAQQIALPAAATARFPDFVSLAAAPDGTVWLVDGQSPVGHVVQLSASGSVLQTVPVGDTPAVIGIASNGYIFVALQGSYDGVTGQIGSVIILSPSGVVQANHTGMFTISAYTSPIMVVQGNTAYTFDSNNPNALRTLSTAGTQKNVSLTNAGYPMTLYSPVLQVDSTGHIWVMSLFSLYRFNATGALVNTIAISSEIYVTYLGLDNLNNVYVVGTNLSSGNFLNLVKKYDASANHLFDYSLLNANVDAVAFNGANDLFALDATTDNYVYIYNSAAGAFLEKFAVPVPLAAMTIDIAGVAWVMEWNYVERHVPLTSQHYYSYNVPTSSYHTYTYAPRNSPVSSPSENPGTGITSSLIFASPSALNFTQLQGIVGGVLGAAGLAGLSLIGLIYRRRRQSQEHAVENLHTLSPPTETVMVSSNPRFGGAATSGAPIGTTAETHDSAGATHNTTTVRTLAGAMLAAFVAGGWQGIWNQIVAAENFLAGTYAAVGLSYNMGVPSEYLTVIFFYGGGLIAGPLALKLPIRALLIFGSVTWMVGVMCTAVITDINSLNFTLGVCVGLGGAFVFWPVLAVIPTRFSTHRAVALGGVLGAAYLGTMTLNLGLTPLMSNVNVGGRTTFIVIGCVGGVLLAAAVLLIEENDTLRNQELASIPRNLGNMYFAMFAASVLLFEFAFFTVSLVAYIALTSLSPNDQASYDAFSPPAMISICVFFGAIAWGVPVSGDNPRISKWAALLAAGFVYTVCVVVVPVCSSLAANRALSFFLGSSAGGVFTLLATIGADAWGPAMFTGGVIPVMCIGAFPAIWGMSYAYVVIYFQSSIHLWGSAAFAGACVAVSMLLIGVNRTRLRESFVASGNGEGGGWQNV